MCGYIVAVIGQQLQYGKRIAEINGRRVFEHSTYSEEKKGGSGDCSVPRVYLCRSDSRLGVVDALSRYSSVGTEDEKANKLLDESIMWSVSSNFSVGTAVGCLTEKEKLYIDIYERPLLLEMEQLT